MLFLSDSNTWRGLNALAFGKFFFFTKTVRDPENRGRFRGYYDILFLNFFFGGERKGGMRQTQHNTDRAACTEHLPLPQPPASGPALSHLSTQTKALSAHIASWRHCCEKAVFYTWDQDRAWSELKSARSGLFCWCIDTNMIMNAGNGWRYVFTGKCRRVTTSNSSESSIKTISLHEGERRKQPPPDISISTQLSSNSKLFIEIIWRKDFKLAKRG